MNYTTINVNVDPKVKLALKSISKKKGKKFSELIRELFEKTIKDELKTTDVNKRHLKYIGIWSDEQADAMMEEYKKSRNIK